MMETKERSLSKDPTEHSLSATEAVSFIARVGVAYAAEKTIGVLRRRGEIKKNYGSKKRFNQFRTDHAAFLEKEKERTEGHHERLEAQNYETKQFQQEIEDPHFQTVDSIPTKEQEGFRFATYHLNRDKQGPPLVVKLGFATGAESRIGRPLLQALCNKVDQPIVVIDTVGTGKTSIPTAKWVLHDMNIETVARAEKEVLDQELEVLGQDSFDLVGISQGGAIGGRLAVLYGDKVRSLITVSTPGFERRTITDFAKAFLYDEAKLDAVIRAEGAHGFAEQEKLYHEIYGDPVTPMKLPPEMFSPRRYPTLLKFANLLRGADMLDLLKNLSEETFWIDLLGTKDRITGYNQHLVHVRARNKHRHEEGRSSNSSIHLLADASHAYSNPQPTTMAEDISQLLKRYQRNNSRRVAA